MFIKDLKGYEEVESIKDNIKKKWPFGLTITMTKGTLTVYVENEEKLNKWKQEFQRVIDMNTLKEVRKERAKSIEKIKSPKVTEYVHPSDASDIEVI